ncbi:BCCT family transporter [Campylobacter pinnipediorum]|uniref:Choline transporter n=1 Tax=Campylobacter pinnipediorum subsp. pinnipediorum TaxID=1660067 RepID=A0AAX0LCA8_9BACT|nr:BCCT family transporter [Campylobacter pinnipediorum]AQW81503.1 BCCT (betaine/carnitine/choline) family transporter [Campylobacter pinnipediorum subsp. pinnipediorum]AQW83131.1 BCCT (betaine/carnitine/choline) family transporter [Campylobacter pinnipediorum subsp. pinnipediorum]AQW84698.1 BCCT (betaine/carnitine/choline) family transporter [Campylobacter pinnipediorum subsp. pinnipediorum]OPA79563.1 choline transporter [Campylobacter pinnipediorum subsp. pinnipediorum]OPA81832.1 choline tra
METNFKQSHSFIVFNGSIIVSLAILILSIIFPEATLKYLKDIQNFLSIKFSWFYTLSITVIFFSILYLCISKFGSIKLGPDHAKPQYGNISWFAMLFSAGMGIGIMFFGVGEPLMHFMSPPNAEPQSIEAAREAMKITFFHWGFSAWAVYGIVAIVLAFFAYRHNLPLTLRSAFYPIVGDKIYGKFGDIVDIFAVVSTLFGVTTSLGYGVLQVNAGFNHLFGVPISATTQIIFIAIITVLVTISVLSGLDKGIKILSNTNMALAILFLFFILFLGNTTELLKALVENTGNYISSFVGDTFKLYAYKKQNDAWLGGWTILYWTWWLSWSPFVGLFIAKISRGRSIREFVVGVLFVPAGFTFMWMSFFGNSAISLVQGGFTELVGMVNKDVSLALFIFLEKFPLSSVLSLIATFMIILFFITSADSAALVMDMLCLRGSNKQVKWQRAFWAIMIGVLSATLLYIGGLSALQSMTMIAALPLTLALLGSIYGLFKALNVDIYKKDSQNTIVASFARGGTYDWKERLKGIIEHPDKDDAKGFLNTVARPAFKEVCDEFKNNNLDANLTYNIKDNKIEVIVKLGEEQDFIYGVKLIKTQMPEFASDMLDMYYRGEVYLAEGGQDYDVIGWSKGAIINDIVEQYAKHIHFLYKVRQDLN